MKQTIVSRMLLTYIPLLFKIMRVNLAFFSSAIQMTLYHTFNGSRIMGHIPFLSQKKTFAYSFKAAVESKPSLIVPQTNNDITHQTLTLG
jgi:hypothetical protein